MSKIKFLFILLCFTPLLWGQSKSSLQKQKEAIEKEIAMTNRLLKSAKNDQRSALSQLVLFEKKIKLQEQMIAKIGALLNELEGKIGYSSQEIGVLNQEIEKLKEDYKKLAILAYKHRNETDALMFVFAAEDVNKAYNRAKYLQENMKQRVRLIKDIRLKQQSLDASISQLNSQRDDQLLLLQEQQKQRTDLESNKQEKQKLVAKLKRNEGQLRAQLNRQIAKKNKLNKAIEDILKKELEASKKNKFKVSPQEKSLGNDFTQNKGKLPWPVDKGVITGKFGKNPHPVLANVWEENNGIDISTPNNSSVRCVFKGTVTAVIAVSGSGYSVIVSHGTYRTIYSNLKNVAVSKGDVLATKQVIGGVLTDPSTGKSLAHLEIWRVSASGVEKENPALWIVK